MPQTTDELDGPSLGLQWQWQSNPDASWWSFDRGSLRLSAVPAAAPGATLWAAGHLLLQKLPAPAFVATTLLRPESLREDEEAGLVVMGRDYAALASRPAGSGARLDPARLPEGRLRRARKWSWPRARSDPGPVELRVEVGEGAVCRFSARTGGGAFEPIGEPFTAREGMWIGAKVGIFARAPHGRPAPVAARFDWFRVGQARP